MLMTLVKTIVSTSNNTLAGSITHTNTNTAVVKYFQYRYQYFCDNTFHCLLHYATFIFPQSSVNKINRMIIVGK